MKWISDLIDLIFPRHCVVCGEVLSAGERDICLNCQFSLPKVEALRQVDTKMDFGRECKKECSKECSKECNR